MILEAIYEPVFDSHSHGFRPGKSCHTALRQISSDFTGVVWFIEGDIQGCFDNINHEKLIEILSRKIKMCIRDSLCTVLTGDCLSLAHLPDMVTEAL